MLEASGVLHYNWSQRKEVLIVAEQAEPLGTLERLRAEQERVAGETREHEPELMGYLEEVHDLYWDCFSLVEGHHISDGVERALIYVGAAAFHSLQSAFILIESGYYRQAAVAIRVLMNEYLICNLARHDPEFAATVVTGCDWPTVRQLAADLLNGPNGLDDCLQHPLSLLSTAVEQRLSFQAFVAADELRRSKAVPENVQRKLILLCDELRKDRMPGMTKLLHKLERIDLSSDRILEYRSDLELLHRHAHAAREAWIPEVMGEEKGGALWHFPRYERGRCRYSGYRAVKWSLQVLRTLTAAFEPLWTDDDWRSALDGFTERFLAWGEEIQAPSEGLNA